MSSNVLNLSNRVLNDSENTLLSKGLHFCPTRHFDLFGALLDVNKFPHSLTLKKNYFSDSQAGDSEPLDTSDSGESLSSLRLFSEVCTLHDLVDLSPESCPCPDDPIDEHTSISFKLRSDFY